MDSDASRTQALNSRRFSLWPGSWAAALIALSGLALTLLTSQLVTDASRQLAKEHFQQLHGTLVSQVITRIQASPDTAYALAALEQSLGSNLPEGLSLRLDTLERHTKTPLLQLGDSTSTGQNETLRTELDIAGNHWMLTTGAGDQLLGAGANQYHWMVITGGSAMTLTATLLALLLCHKLHMLNLTLCQQDRHHRHLDRQVANLKTEKNILRQALDDSESRCRDLINLSGGLVGQLDEHGHIGYLSDQAADLLGIAPSDLINHPFTTLVSEQERTRFSQCLESARREVAIARVDLQLIHQVDQLPVQVVLRVMALRDTVYGLTGFRLSASALNSSPSGS